MIIQAKEVSFESPWRFALVPPESDALKEQLPPKTEIFEIDGTEVDSLRSFHEEVAADFFFASHYNCDPNAPLAHLEAPLSGDQIVIFWQKAEEMAANEPDDWDAVLSMFRAAMATLHPQGTYLRLVFPTDDAPLIHQALNNAFAEQMTHAGVGFDYETEESELDFLHH